MIFCAAAGAFRRVCCEACLSADEIEDEWVTCKSPWGGYCDYSVCTHCYNRVGGQAKRLEGQLGAKLRSRLPEAACEKTKLAASAFLASARRV